MEGKHLNIIAFDVPYPPNYGGICDVFYKVKYLHEAGARIIYHCFYYEGHNPPTHELNKYCEEVHYYERKKSMFKVLFGSLPYVVSSRQDPQLLKNLLSNNYPVLFDGIQTCFYLHTEGIKNRRRLYRANNIEHLYYAFLAKSEASLLRKIYLRREAKKLKRFENELKGVDAILCVARMDIPHFEQYAPTFHIPPFFNGDVENELINDAESRRFVLFHGNLSVQENDVAARWIIDKIAPGSAVQFVIAGKEPSASLLAKAEKQKNVQLYNSPGQDIMDQLIRDAHIHLLITNQQTGIKLKLLNALQSGKHIIINSLMDDDGIFADMCSVVDKPVDISSKIDELMKVDFTAELKSQRDKKFNRYYNNQRNAKNILDLL